MEIKLKLNSSDRKDEYELSALVEIDGKPYAGGLFSKKDILEMLEKKINNFTRTDLQLCTENIETLGNAIRRIDDDIAEIKKQTIENDLNSSRLYEKIVALNEKVDRLTIKNKVAEKRQNNL